MRKCNSACMLGIFFSEHIKITRPYICLGMSNLRIHRALKEVHFAHIISAACFIYLWLI